MNKYNSLVWAALREDVEMSGVASYLIWAVKSDKKKGETVTSVRSNNVRSDLNHEFDKKYKVHLPCDAIYFS